MRPIAPADENETVAALNLITIIVQRPSHPSTQTDRSISIPNLSIQSLDLSNKEHTPRHLTRDQNPLQPHLAMAARGKNSDDCVSKGSDSRKNRRCARL
jgi:hypothetical protein